MGINAEYMGESGKGNGVAEAAKASGGLCAQLRQEENLA